MSSSQLSTQPLCLFSACVTSAVAISQMAVILLPSDSAVTLLLVSAICLNVFSVIASALLRQQTLLEGIFFCCFCITGESRHGNVLLCRAAVKRWEPAGKTFTSGPFGTASSRLKCPGALKFTNMGSHLTLEQENASLMCMKWLEINMFRELVIIMNASSKSLKHLYTCSWMKIAFFCNIIIICVTYRGFRHCLCCAVDSLLELRLGLLVHLCPYPYL